MNQALLEEPELLSEVPPILKRLAKMIAYAFYEAEHVAIMCLLTVVPCVDEDTLIDRLNFDKRQLKQALTRMIADNLVKQRVHKEKQIDSNNFNVYNFYFINYKLFVNVVKYKLDHIRKKLESDEQMAKNRPSFTCTNCENKYSDLEVDRLLDFMTGLLKCLFCGGSVEEDVSSDNRSVKRSSLALFNDQMEPIFKLLQACENINLAPEVLEPEPTTIQLKAAANRSHSGSAKSGWSTDRKAIDLYDQSISVNVGEKSDKGVKKEAPKELPVWMSQSTVFKPDEQSSSLVDATDSKRVNNKSTKDSGETDIMSDLLAHETASKKPKLEIKAKEQLSEDSDSDSANDEPTVLADSDINLKREKVDQNLLMENEESVDDEEEEVMVKVGSEMFPISKVVNDHSITERMTPNEHEQYLQLYHKYCEQFY